MQRRVGAKSNGNATAQASPVRPSAVSGHYTRASNPYGTEVSIVGVGLTLGDPERSAPIAFEFELATQLYADLSGDLRSGGLFIATYRMLPVGTRVELEIELSDWTRLYVLGRVSWQRRETQGESRPGMGIAFEELSPTALAALSSCCSANPPLYFDP